MWLRVTPAPNVSDMLGKDVTGAGSMNGILCAMAVVNPIAGTAMCDGLRTKSCLGLDRLISPPGNGTEKLAGSPASLPIINLYMVTYLSCKNTNSSSNQRVRRREELGRSHPALLDE